MVEQIADPPYASPYIGGCHTEWLEVKAGSGTVPAPPAGASDTSIQAGWEQSKRPSSAWRSVGTMRFPQPCQVGQKRVQPRQIALEAEVTLTEDCAPVRRGRVEQRNQAPTMWL